MATNNILPWASGTDANVLTDADYASALAANGTYQNGVQAGQASSKQANKTWRQAIAPASGVAQFIVDNLGVDVSDSDSQSIFSARLTNASIKLGQISPYNSAYAATVGGYKLNDIVSDPSTSGVYWRSTVSNNLTVPGASGATWAAIVTDTAMLQWHLFTSSTTITLPAWARGFEVKAIAGGGSGAYCYSSGTTQVSGGGGGAGGFAWGAYYPGPGTVLTLSIGAQGGNTTVAWGGSTNVSCYGGGNSGWPTNWSSPGGDGGAAGGGNIMNVTGGRGNDGMAGTSASGQIVYNIGARGSSSQFGEGGRAGQGGGADAVGYGAGGGGAYDLTGSATAHSGGAGMQGCALIRFLP